MASLELDAYRSLSIPALMAVALNCLERWCNQNRLRYPAIDKFIDHMWELPCSQNLPDWERQFGEMARFGLGDPLPCSTSSFQSSVGISEEELREMIGCTLEIAYINFYGAARPDWTWQMFSRVVGRAATCGIPLPPATPFVTSQFSDHYGWGKPITPSLRNVWRYSAYSEELL